MNQEQLEADNAQLRAEVERLEKLLGTRGTSFEAIELRARVAELEKERIEWSLIYRRDYGHDWDTRGNYKGF